MRNYKNRIIVFKEARLLSHLQHVIRAGEIPTGVKFNYHNAGKYASTKSLWKGDGKEQYQEPDHKLKKIQICKWQDVPFCTLGMNESF